MKHELGLFLQSQGYFGLPVQLEEYAIFFKEENHCINVICIVNAINQTIHSEQYWKLKQEVIELFEKRGSETIHFMTITLTDSFSSSFKIVNRDGFYWSIDTGLGKLIQYEDSVEDFYGLRSQIDKFLGDKAIGLNTQMEYDRLYEQKKESFPVISFLLVASNVLLYIICTFTGNLLYNIGALSMERVINSGEIYRMITSMFLHWDINHLASNMLILFFAGEMVEREFGKIRFAVLYFFAGISGSLLSLIYEYYASKVIISAGASGAIYGLIGCLLVLVLVNGGRYGEMKLARVILLIAYLLYSGFADQYVNNAAHIGGFLGGAVIAVPFWYIRKWRSKKVKQNNKNNKREVST